MIAYFYLISDETYDVTTGDKLTTNQISAFAVGGGGFGGPRNSRHLIPCVEPPKRKPCVSVTQKTSPDQVRIKYFQRYKTI